MDLISLKEFNDKKLKLWTTKSSPKNGIACPQCKTELEDSNPAISLMSNPPQKNIHCPSCGWAGFRIA